MGATTECKFKAGDRVRVTKDGLSTTGAVGMLGYVRHIAEWGGGFPIQVEMDKGGEYQSKAHIDSYRWSWFNVDALELVPVAEATGTDDVAKDKPKFKVGDSVRVSKSPTNGGYGEIGDTGTVAYVGTGVVRLAFNTGKCAGGAWWISNDEIEPIAVAQQQPFVLREGAYYRTRDGRKVGPMKSHSSKDHPWLANFKNDTSDPHVLIFKSDGKNYELSHLDLIAEWVDAPAVAAPTPTNGFTVPLDAVLDEAASNVTALRAELEEIDARMHHVEFAAHSDELTIADIVRRLEALESKRPPKPWTAKIKKGDLVTFNRPGLVTGVNGYTAHVQTDGGNYSVPLAALRAA